MVRRAPAPGAKPESAQPTGDRSIRTVQQSTEHRGIQAGMKDEKCVFIRCPWRARAGGRACNCGRDPKLARAASHRLGGATEKASSILRRAHGQDATETRVVCFRPESGVRGKAEFPRACGDRSRSSMLQRARDLATGQTLGIAIPHDRVLRAGPSPPSRWAMEPKLRRAQPHRLRPTP
jgi:hypothetical protein